MQELISEILNPERKSFGEKVASLLQPCLCEQQHIALKTRTMQSGIRLCNQIILK